MDVCGLFGGVCGDLLFVWRVSVAVASAMRICSLTVDSRFFKTMAGFAYNIPVVGPYLARGLQVAGDKAGANERAHKDLPV